MIATSLPQPDIKLVLDMDGMILDATLANGLAEEAVDTWLGHPWLGTVEENERGRLARLLSDARQNGVSGYGQVTQRLPSGQLVPIEYTTFRLGGDAGLIAVGKHLRAVVELESRLIEAQRTLEEDHWKLRSVETRYRLLFETSSDAVLTLDASDLRIVEINPAAAWALAGHGPANRHPGKGLRGTDLLTLLAPEEREGFAGLAQRTRDHGPAPGMLLHLGNERAPWMVRASSFAAEGNGLLLVQLTPANADVANRQHAVTERGTVVSLEELIARCPDAYVIMDRRGAIVRANSAFVEMAQVGSEGSLLGGSFGRWIRRPGADWAVLLSNVQRFGMVRRFATTVVGELGSETEVELSAVGNSGSEPAYIGVLLRDVGRRLESEPQDTSLGDQVNALAEHIGTAPLFSLISDSVAIVERHYIEAALGLADHNRTVAAELLGLSRQSLYAKLSRYGLTVERREPKTAAETLDDPDQAMPRG